MPHAFFRLVSSNPATIADVLSKQALGEPLREDTAENRRLWSGISVYATEAQARRKGRASPVLGQFIARIELPDDPPIKFERTTASSGHRTLWGEASVILQCITHIVTVAHGGGST